MRQASTECPELLAEIEFVAITMKKSAISRLEIRLRQGTGAAVVTTTIFSEAGGVSIVSNTCGKA
jgi:hypothetical protein